MKQITYYALALLIALVVLGFMFAPTPPALPVLGSVGTFSLEEASLSTAPSDDSFSTERLIGRVWMATLFFTSCDGPCPIASAHLTKLLQSFDASAPLSLVSITVDPERDTVEELSAYAKRFYPGARNVHFLRGSREEISRVAKQHLKVGFGQEAQMHSTRVVLIDQRGDIRGYYPSVEAEAFRKLRKDICALLEDTASC